MGRHNSRSRSRSRDRNKDSHHRQRRRSRSNSRERYRSRRRSKSGSPPAGPSHVTGFYKISFQFSYFNLMHHASDICKCFLLLGRQQGDKFKEFRSRPADGAFVPRGKGSQFSEEYYDYRRKEREQIGTMGVPAAWSGSPSRIQWYD